MVKEIISFKISHKSKKIVIKLIENKNAYVILNSIIVSVKNLINLRNRDKNNLFNVC
ncbi:MAG: hypothetical protein PWQ73_362 [Petrotoga sp.]|nr:hypothetical protein [Petrotoga sp.]